MHLENIEIIRDRVEITIRATTNGAVCPNCQRISNRRHSYYLRQLDDLPLTGHPLLLRWQVCRFFCDNPACPKRTFAEQLYEVALPYAHRTVRQAQMLTQVGLALGGRAGQRLALLLSMPTSSSTLLRLLRKIDTAKTGNATRSAPVRLLGVDDFAWRKDTKYGTILIDLEKHRPIDLLAQRSADSLAAWLEEHPEVEIISRDRSHIYADGANRGAPQAVQVADRFHLVQNLGMALERFFERKGIWKLAIPVILPVVLPASSNSNSQETPGFESNQSRKTNLVKSKTSTRSNSLALDKTLRHQKRLDLYEQVVKLHQKGMSNRNIALQLKLNRATVKRFLQAGQFPEVTYRTRYSQLDPYKPYLVERWEEGQHNALRLFEEIQGRGFNGSVDLVRRFVQGWRPNSNGATVRDNIQNESTGHISIKEAARLFVSDPAKLKEEGLKDLTFLRQWDEQFEKGYELTQGFKKLVKERPGKPALEEWIKTAQASASEGLIEIASFAKGLKADELAVVAGLSLPYSNGQTEGQVNRLKLIKRSMFGRANFDLLRTRVLAA